MTIDVQVQGDGSLATADAVRVVDAAVRAALAHAEVEEGELSVTLLDDAGMAALNARWKERSGPTDVLAFALYEDGEAVTGDIYLGLDRARVQAAELGEPAARELARIAVHGVLHVLGWDHPEDGREESEMWDLQERIVEALEGV